MTEITQADRDLAATAPGIITTPEPGTRSYRYIPEDSALRAIAKARQQGREDALREAAAICTKDIPEWKKHYETYRECYEVVTALTDAGDAILALIEKEVRDQNGGEQQMTDTPTLPDDLQTIAEMRERWRANEALRTSRHNAMFHLEKAWYRLTDYLAEAQQTIDGP